MTTTRYPAASSDTASCHTRRSKGTERFSTRISTLLPRDADIPLTSPPLISVRKPNEIDDQPTVCFVQRLDRLGVRGPDYQDLGMLEHLLDRVREQRREMRDPLLDEIAVCADQSGE